MASGKTHDLVNLVALPPIVYYLSPADFIFFIGGYLAGTFFLSPDLDIYHSKPVKRWKFLKFIWKPYSKFSKHRGVSHIPFYGSFLKILYLALIFLGIYLLIFYTLNYFEINSNLLENGFTVKNVILNKHTISFLFGLIMAEIMHIFVDFVYSSLKKVKLIK